MIVHEYGHAIQDDAGAGLRQLAREAGAIGEGFGDYWAVTVSAHRRRTDALRRCPCVADWDSDLLHLEPVPHCLRRVDGNKHYPEDVDGEVHADGEIWSRALWDIRNALGATPGRHDHPRRALHVRARHVVPRRRGGDDRHSPTAVRKRGRRSGAHRVRGAPFRHVDRKRSGAGEPAPAERRNNGKV